MYLSIVSIISYSGSLGGSNTRLIRDRLLGCGWCWRGGVCVGVLGSSDLGLGAVMVEESVETD